MKWDTSHRKSSSEAVNSVKIIQQRANGRGTVM